MTDENLIEQALAGQQPAFAALVKRYESFAYTLALRVTRSREDAREVAQDSFLRAFRYLPDFRGECKFSTWLYRIVYSTALNRIRKNTLETRSLDDDEKPLRLPDEGTPDAAHALETRERNAELHAAIQQLSPDDAGIITLFYLHEQTLDEICTVMNLTMTNAKTKLCRARQRLRQKIEERHDAEIFAPG